MKRYSVLAAILCIVALLLVSCTGAPAYSPPEVISAPSTPSGPSTGNIAQVLTYTTGGAISSLGHSIQYRFNWGDGSYSDWSSSTSASHSWSSPGNYMVQAQARSSANSNIISSWSGSKSVTINSTPKATPTPSPPESSPTPKPSPTKQIIIKYSALTTGQIGRNEADPGHIYLVLDLDIKNDGYDSFTTNPYYFYVIVNNVKYDPALLAWPASTLKWVDLLDGGRISGKIVFEVPEDGLSAGYQLGYESYGETYSIKWMEQ